MKKAIALLSVLALFLGGCSTATYVKLPKNATVQIYERDAQHSEGLVKTRPFFWTTTGAGIPYRVEQNGKTLSQGRLHSRFRVASIFWPPYAIIYWPMGFGQKCYDLSSQKPQICSGDTLQSLKASAEARKVAGN